MRVLRRIALAVGIVITTFAIYLLVLVATTPDVDSLRTTAPTQTSFMRMRGPTHVVDWVDLDEISPYLVCAVVKAEDRGFFTHNGFEPGQLRKAAWGYLTGARRPGGSTITQQLAKNLYLGPERTLHRKLREALLARRLERVLDKRRILALYLNVVEWGDGVWGAKQAARIYFDRSAAELGPYEAAVLASMLPAPRAGAHLVRAQKSQRRVLHQLQVSGIIDRAQHADAKLKIIGLAHGAPVMLEDVLASACGEATERGTVSRIVRRSP